MPSGYEIWSDANPPPTGMQNENRGGLLWDRGNGERYLVKGGQFYPLDETQWKSYAPKPSAGEQAEALGPNEAGGMTAREASAQTGMEGTNRVARRDQKRAKAEQNVQRAVSAERAAQSGPMGGLSLVERAAVTKLVQQGIPEAEAVKRVRSVTASDQAGALE